MILRLANAGIRFGVRIIYLRYVAVSATALAIDMALFLVLIGGGTPPTAASVLGYSTGIAAHWVLSSRAVFAARTAKRGPARHRQKVLFLLSAIAGLAITAAIVALGSYSGLEAWLAKLVAIAVSFQTTWLIRKKGVFTS